MAFQQINVSGEIDILATISWQISPFSKNHWCTCSSLSVYAAYVRSHVPSRSKIADQVQSFRFPSGQPGSLTQSAVNLAATPGVKDCRSSPVNPFSISSVWVSNAVGSESGCNTRGRIFEPQPSHITFVEIDHEMKWFLQPSFPLPVTDESMNT